MMCYTVLIYFTLFCAVVTSTPDYYWRPFDGTIPTDALVATSDGVQNTYIGNVPIYGGGLYIGQLYPGINQITVTGASQTSEGAVHIRNEYIQILCTRSAELFNWQTVNASTLHTTSYHLVKGGYELSIMGVLYVGRINYSGLRIGKISGYHYTDEDIIFIADGQNEIGFGTYEVLVYRGLKEASNNNTLS